MIFFNIQIPAKDISGQDTSFDDFREAYDWMKTHTPQNSKVLAWWDYGYQITTLANRTSIVDNRAPSLNEKTIKGRAKLKQLSDVSKMFISNEDVSWPLMQAYDVDYVMVVFGGMTGYVSDDINSFLWMVQIAKDKYGMYFKAKESEHRVYGKHCRLTFLFLVKMIFFFKI